MQDDIACVFDSRFIMSEITSTSQYVPRPELSKQQVNSFVLTATYSGCGHVQGNRHLAISFADDFLRKVSLFDCSEAP